MSIQFGYIEQIDEVSESQITPHNDEIESRRNVFANRWPIRVGIGQMTWGSITVLLGILEVFILPIAEDNGGMGKDVLSLYLESNCHAVALWAGFMLVLAGSFAVRATFTRRALAVYRFFIMEFLCMMVYIIAIILIIRGYSSGKTTQHSYPPDSGLFETHILVSVAIIIGLVLQLYAFIQYYEDILFGELKLLSRCLECLGVIVCCRLRTSQIPHSGETFPEIV